MQKKYKDNDKTTEFYSVTLNAWYDTRLEKDRSLLSLSAFGLAFLAALSAICNYSIIISLILMFAAVSFLMSIVIVLSIFSKNADYLMELNNNSGADEYTLKNLESTLQRLDKAAYFSFVFGAISTLLVYTAPFFLKSITLLT